MALINWTHDLQNVAVNGTEVTTNNTGATDDAKAQSAEQITSAGEFSVEVTVVNAATRLCFGLNPELEPMTHQRGSYATTTHGKAALGFGMSDSNCPSRRQKRS